MDSPAGHQWFLRKHEDGSIFGPLAFAQLAGWASSAQVAPHDCISTDQASWMKAPMLPELGMDWIAEVTSESLYGPTTLGAIAEFMRLGEIDENTFVINSCNATRRQIREIAPLLPARAEGDSSQRVKTGDSLVAPSPSGMSIAVPDRIRELEQALREERRALVLAEQRYRELELKYRELAGTQSAS